MKIIHLLEAYDTSKARIDHPEDLVITAGSRGAMSAIAVLEKAGAGQNSMSIKPDGKPAIKWGRDTAGFAMGDKYMNPLPHSSDELANLLASRKGGGRDDLAALYAHLWPMFEASVGGINGFLFGDLMYSSTPPVDGNDFVFKPNTVEYRVAVNSVLGKRMARSQAGIVVHTFLPIGSHVGQHITDPQKISGVNPNGALLIMSDSIPSGASIKPPNLSKVKSAVASNSQVIDAFVDAGVLAEKKIKGMIPLMIKYVNERVRSRSFDSMAQGFIEYVDSAASGKMAEGIKQHINENRKGYTALWAIFQALSQSKNFIVDQLDNTQGDLRGSIGAEQGQEGYIVHTTNGPIKLVNRFKFSATHFGA